MATIEEQPALREAARKTSDRSRTAIDDGPVKPTRLPRDGRMIDIVEEAT